MRDVLVLPRVAVPLSNGDSYNLAEGTGYPEPWWVRLLGPVQPGAIPA
jgi:hypothetical protein